jgi:hypothetical protein
LAAHKRGFYIFDRAAAAGAAPVKGALPQPSAVARPTSATQVPAVKSAGIAGISIGSGWKPHLRGRGECNNTNHEERRQRNDEFPKSQRARKHAVISLARGNHIRQRLKAALATALHIRSPGEKTGRGVNEA